MSIYKNVIPPTINLKNQDDRCTLDYNCGDARETKIQYAMNNSFGFGGTNSSLVFKKI